MAVRSRIVPVELTGAPAASGSASVGTPPALLVGVSVDASAFALPVALLLASDGQTLLDVADADGFYRLATETVKPDGSAADVAHPVVTGRIEVEADGSEDAALGLVFFTEGG